MVYFFNTFGITPSKNFEAAGYDWYVPNINDYNDKLIDNYVIPALFQSYKVNEKSLNAIIRYLDTNINDKYYLDIDDDEETLHLNKQIQNCFKHNIYNTVLLYLSFVAKSNKQWMDIFNNPTSYPIMKFVYNNLVFDIKKNVVGIKLAANDTLLINAGIKEVLPSGYAGVFMNKSGRGSSGYDVRACVVDEDYTGYVHLNVAFTGNSSKNSIIYCGDKLVQQLILPLYKEQSKEITEDEFLEMTSKSKRGSAGFGSSNEKH